MDDASVRQTLLFRIVDRRGALQRWVKRNRSRSNRLAVLGVIAGAVGTVVTAGPAVGGTSFTESVAAGSGLDGDLAVWQTACLIALVVSVVSAVTAGLLKHYDLASRLGAAEAALIELDNLRILLEVDRIPVAEALARYQQSIATVPFVDDDPTALPPSPTSFPSGQAPAYPPR